MVVAYSKKSGHCAGFLLCISFCGMFLLGGIDMAKRVGGINNPNPYFSFPKLNDLIYANMSLRILSSFKRK